LEDLYNHVKRIDILAIRDGDTSS